MKRCLFACMLMLFSLMSAAKPITLVMWHSLAGALGEELKHLVENFNHSQSDYRITMVYKGEYSETLTSFSAAFRAKQPPSMVQIFEVGTATMLAPKGIIKPVASLLHEQGISIPLAHFLPAVREAYSLAGQLQAMPLNTSVPVIFYNKDALAAIGVKENEFPKTWQALEKVAHRLRQAGYPCVYTSAYAAWIQIESFAAIHHLSLVDEAGRANYNNKAIIGHISRLQRWQKEHYFEYGGRTNDATVLFTSGRCPMFSQSSGSYTSLAELVRFHLGVAPMPLDEEVSPVRYNNVIGGAALWAVDGQSSAQYQGIARFFAFLANPKVQQNWYHHTGYLPLSATSYQKVPAEEAVLALAKEDLSREPTAANHPYPLPQNQIRSINDEALEAVFSGIKSPEEALNDAVKRANITLMRFARNTGREILLG